MLTRMEVIQQIDQLVEERSEMDGRKTKDKRWKKQIITRLAQVIESGVDPVNLVVPGVSYKEKELLLEKMKEYEEKYELSAGIEWGEGPAAEITMHKEDSDFGDLHLAATPFTNDWGNTQFDLTFDDAEELPRQLGWVIREHFGLEDGVETLERKA